MRREEGFERKMTSVEMQRATECLLDFDLEWLAINGACAFTVRCVGTSVGFWI